MSKCKSFIKTVSIILSLLILLTALPLGATATDVVVQTPNNSDIVFQNDNRVRSEER